MDESKFGKRDNSGHWAPDARISYGPFFSWPPQIAALFKWLFGYPGYFLPWNVLYAVLAIVIWQFLSPSLDSFSANTSYWIAVILARNIVLAILVFGGWHLWLYTWRRQGTAFKYNQKWPKDSSAFCLTIKGQTICSGRW